LKNQPGFAEAFMPNGRAPAAGELFKAPGHAYSLKLIAETKGEAFYRGELAQRIAAFAREHGAVLTAADMAEHRNDWCGTIHQDFGDASLHEIPPNGQGIAALMALGIMRAYGTDGLALDSGDAFHLQIEATKLAFADVYAYAADLDYMRDVTVAHLLNPTYLASRAKLIDRSRAQDFGAGAPKTGGTVCLSTGDASGMMVSYIQSNYSGFGSGVVVPGTGISLQNRGFGFILTEGHPNQVGPRKRPFQTIIPGFVMQGKAPLMAFGLMGGPMQAQGHLQIMLRMQLWGQDPQTAADAPRWRYVAGLKVAIETAVPDNVAADLASRGHVIEREPPDSAFGFGGAQLVRRIDGGYVAGSDPRKDGLAAGF
jgi:gamma-glutamyltranspeptidase/glutathione hydrolase